MSIESAINWLVATYAISGMIVSACAGLVLAGFAVVFTARLGLWAYCELRHVKSVAAAVSEWCQRYPDKADSLRKARARFE